MLNQNSNIKQNQRMPVLFLGHGSPMNAIETNSYTQAISNFGKHFTKPKAILMISAHWMTKGTWVTGMIKPKTIHDFYGFPDELFAVQYPADGSPELALEIQNMISNPKIKVDDKEWGLDHGTWSVLRHLFPKADVPVIQLSLDLSQPSEYHYNLGQQLSHFRDKEVLIIGSGNIVHNLRRISWKSDAPVMDWAQEFDTWVKNNILQRNFKALMNDFHQFESGKLSVPSLDHYLPLVYILGASRPDDQIGFIYEDIQNASIAMRSVCFGE